MQVSYFETGRYYAPSNLPREWPMPAGAYDREAGMRAFRGMQLKRSIARYRELNPAASGSWHAVSGQRTVYDRRDAISRRHPWLAMDQGSAPRAREGLKTQQMVNVLRQPVPRRRSDQ